MRGAVESSGSKGPKDKERRQPSSWCFLETRHIVLLLLVVQSTSIVLLMRYSKTRPLESSTSPPYFATAAVLMAELLKLPTCTIMAARTVGVGDLRRLLATELPSRDTLKCAIPAVAFTVQGNLLFIALANLEAPTYQVTYQCKTLFTALFSWLILGRQLKQSQWLALFLLVCGTILVSDPWHGRSKPSDGSASAQSMTTGILAVLAAAILSSSSSVYFEMMLKKKPAVATNGERDVSLWLRNIQLGIFAMPLAAIAMMMQDGAFVWQYGMLQGFDSIVWIIVVLNGLGGLLVAATMKYADNIAKCFATAIAIVSGTILSVPIFDFQLAPIFGIGATCTVIASSLYSAAPECGGAQGTTVATKVKRASDEELEPLADVEGDGPSEPAEPSEVTIRGGAVRR